MSGGTGRGGLLRALVGTPTNAALTVAMVALFALVVPPFWTWAVTDATWNATSRKACAPDGACWAFIARRFALFFYGRYPEPERWRVNLGFGLLVGILAACLFAQRRRGAWLLALLLGVPSVGSVLLVGGAMGLPYVPTSDWGGLMLNVILTFVAVAGALPLGAALAFGRRSATPAIRWGCAGFVEFWRGVPLLAVLFMGLVMLPLFLPAGMTVDNLVRAAVVLTLFESAYMAEVIRGGLQGVAAGQTEAARALGMHHAQVQALVVLPQAMRLAVPGIVNIVVDLFKDTTLVSIVGVFDLLGVVLQSLKDQAWLGLAAEGYTFAAILFFSCCLLISLAGQALERRLGSTTATPRR